MDTISTDFQTALASGTTFCAYALRVQRKDGTVFGFTRTRVGITLPELTITLSDGVSTISVPSTYYDPRAALQVTNLERSEDISATDNLDCTLTANDAWLPLAHVAKGLFEGAYFWLLIYDWQTPAGLSGPAPRIMLKLRGRLGALAIDGNAVTWKLRSLSSFLKRKLLDITSPLSRARWGDPELAFFTPGTGTNTSDGFASKVTADVATVDGTYTNRQFTVTGTIGFPADRFTNGLVTWNSGPNAGATCLVLQWDSSDGTFQLDEDAPYPISVGDNLTAEIAAPVRKEDWFAYFGTMTGFAGEILIPVVEQINSVR